MAKLNREDLQTAIDANVQESLLTDTDDAKSMEAAVDDFIYNSTSELQGEVWDASRQKMSQYKEALSKRMNAASILHDAINDALKKLNEAMEDYPDLDTSKLEQYRDELKQNKDARDSMTYSKPETASNDKDDESSFDVNKYNYLSSEIDRLEKLIAATENFKKVYEEVEQDLANAFEEVKNICGDFTTIEPSSPVTFSA